MKFPRLPINAAYLTIDNAARRNALSFDVLKSLRDQMTRYNTSPADGKSRFLPPFSPSLIDKFQDASEKRLAGTEASDFDWLVDVDPWDRHRAGLPKVLVLRSDGPVFSSGHDLKELRGMSKAEISETFALCAEVMTLIRRSPAPVVGAIQGLATAAGAQLAFTTDLPVACASTLFSLPGASIGLPCTSPSTALSRAVGNAFTYRMFATAEPVRADRLPGGAIETVPDMAALESRLAEMVGRLATKISGQSQALGKWAYWTQASIGTNDPDHDVTSWAGKMMAIHAKSADAKEGISSFVEKRSPNWKT